MINNKDILKKRKVSRFSWIEYIGVFSALAFFSALPGIMYGYNSGIFHIIWDYFFWYLLYWAILTVAFCSFTAYQKYKAFDLPMNLLCEATKKVAEGDFSVYLKPIHGSEQSDYIDQMFNDFNLMVKELGSLETMKTDFIANVSHEIKTPLAVIQNYASALESSTISTEKKEFYASTIANAAKKLSELISNILTLNKLENQGIVTPPKPYDICRQLAESIFILESLLEDKHIELNIDIEDRAFVQADQQLMEIVWRNLLSNAIKFTQPSGIITVHQVSTEEEIIVTISDTGEGMSKKTVRHMFDKFYQGDTSHSREGNGLGMSLVLRIIEMMEGNIEVTSKVNEGTSITITLLAAE